MNAVKACFLGLFLSVQLGLGQTVFPPTPTSTPSPLLAEKSSDSTNKIHVKGSTKEVRTRVVRIASDVRESLYELVGLSENSQVHELHLTLYGKQGEPRPPRLMRKGFSLVAGELFFTLDLHLANGINEALLEDSIHSLLLAEVGVRNTPFKNEEELKLQIPPWLSTGTLEAIRWKENKLNRDLYASLFRQGVFYPIEDLLEEEPSTELGVLQSTFRASSGVFIMALLNQPQGKKGLLALIQEAFRYEGESRALIQKHFPDATLSKNSLAKWWSLQLATMSQRPAEQLNTITETLHAMDDLLTIEITDPDGNIHTYTPANYPEMKRISPLYRSRPIVVCINELALFQVSAFPSFRPLIAGYQQVLMKISETPKKKTFWSFFTRNEEKHLNPAEMLGRLEKERAILANVGERVTDYLNWYQLETGDTEDATFQSYLDVKKQIQETSPSDGGYISQYLDDLEKLFGE